MRRPPLISFLTFNRLGNTAISLPSLLRTEDDFELFIIDNGSADNTWEFLNDTKDPRIKYKIQFKENIGVVHGLNYILSFRQKDQDFINFEYDYRIHNKNFVHDFRRVVAEYPEMAAVSATIFPAQYKEFTEYIEKYPKKIQQRNNVRVFLDYILGYCVYIPYETMNQLMYYNEIDCFGDVELNLRFRGMGKVMGYAMDIHVSHSEHAGHCDTCLAYHTYCKGYDAYRVPECFKYYEPFVSKVMDAIQMYPRYSVIRQRADKEGVFPEIKCGSVFDENTMFKSNIEESKAVMNLYKELTNKHYEKIREANND
jgi:glycosyltransferase involved in cell wall biosynthesis